MTMYGGHGTQQGDGDPDIFFIGRGDGHIIIADFEDGIDLIDVRNLNFDSYEQMMTHSTETTRGIIIDYEDTMIDIYGIDPSAGDFLI